MKHITIIRQELDKLCSDFIALTEKFLDDGLINTTEYRKIVENKNKFIVRHKHCSKKKELLYIQIDMWCTDSSYSSYYDT